MAQALKSKLPVRRSEIDNVIERGCVYGKTNRQQIVSGQSPAHRQLKMAIAALLCEKIPQRDRGKIEDALNCSSSFISGARALAQQQGNAGDAFRALLTEIRNTSDASLLAPATPGTNSLPESQEERLKRLARVSFNVDSLPPGNAQRKAIRSANCAVAYIMRWVMKKELNETAALVGVERISVETILQEAWEEYRAKYTFYDKVVLICEELGLTP